MRRYVNFWYARLRGIRIYFCRAMPTRFCTKFMKRSSKRIFSLERQRSVISDVVHPNGVEIQEKENLKTANGPKKKKKIQFIFSVSGV